MSLLKGGMTASEVQTNAFKLRYTQQPRFPLGLQQCETDDAPCFIPAMSQQDQKLQH